jgi:hypothetical protein
LLYLAIEEDEGTDSEGEPYEAEAWESSMDHVPVERTHGFAFLNSYTTGRGKEGKNVLISWI